MFFQLESLLHRWRRRVSRNEWALRRLRLPASQDTGSEPGLLLIQIDGLARKQFEAALAKGRMPFLRSLLRRHDYELGTFYSGLPSATPAVQGEIFYGQCCAVPSFGFVDRKTKRVAAMFHPDWAKKIEAGMAAEHEPLLKDGSSWSNIYSGGASPENTHFCAAGIGLGDFHKSISLFGLLSIFVLQFPAVLRAVGLFFLEILISIWDVIQGVRSGESIAKEIKFVISRIFVCIALREIVTIGAGVDLARGLPVVHVNFLGYDEQSHRRGPGSAFAHWSLRGIDFAIKKLYRGAERSERRDYQIWIYSDHGQERARAYDDTHPASIEGAIQEAVAHFRQAARRQSRRVQESNSRASWAGGKQVRKRLEKRAAAEPLSEEENNLFAVAAMGPVGHVYFAWDMSVEEKKAYARWLVDKHQVAGILFRTAPGEALWVHARGSWKVPEEAAKHLPHEGELKQAVAQDLLKLAEQEYSGDLILLGWASEGQPWTFAQERGAHGGLGVNETQGFLLVPAKTRFPESARAFVRPGDLRKAALHHLRRRRLPARKPFSEISPVEKLRVMTYNVHSCIGMDGKISPHRIARVIALNHPDIVALQEIDLGRVRSRGHDQAKMIAEEMHMHVAFCPTVTRGNELYGHALLSRFPIEVCCAGLLCGGPAPVSCEPRGALLARTGPPEAPIYILNTHFGLGRLERASQASDLLGNKWLGAIGLDQPLIVCGDFNMLPGSLPYRTLASRLKDVQLALKNHRPQKTFSARMPFGRIDHIFVSSHFEVSKVMAPHNSLTKVASDHLPLIADLSLRTGAYPRELVSSAETAMS